MTRPGFTGQTRATSKGKVKAVGYLRVSDPKQATIDRESLPRQEADIRDYCERRGYEVVRFYVDAGISGSSRNRPAFQEMLADIPTGKFDVIVAWRGDRLTRGLRPTVALKDALEGTEVQLEASNDYVDRRQLSIKAAFAEEELEAIRERTKMGAFGRALKGKLKGKIKYGYAMDPQGYPEIDEAKAQIVRRVFELYLTTDLAATGISKLLTEECVPSPGGGRWYPAVVSTILRDTTYIGQGHWNRLHHYRKDDGKGRDRVITVHHDRDQWLDIAYPPIINEETFKAAERRRRNYTQPRRAGPDTPDFPLKGVLWCPVHLCNYTTSHSTGMAGWLIGITAAWLEAAMLKRRDRALSPM